MQEFLQKRHTAYLCQKYISAAHFFGARKAWTPIIAAQAPKFMAEFSPDFGFRSCKHENDVTWPVLLLTQGSALFSAKQLQESVQISCEC